MYISFPTEMYLYAVSLGSRAVGHGKMTKEKKKEKKKNDYFFSLSFPSVKDGD